MFDLVFLLDSSSKSTFAQNKSCRSSFALQLLFWPNFTFPYQILSFGQSKSGQTRVKLIQLVRCSSPVLVAVLVRRPYRRLAAGERRHASAIAPRRRSSSALWFPRDVLVFVSPFSFLALDAEQRRARATVAHRTGQPSPPRLF